jgi:hypothetical protein
VIARRFVLFSVLCLFLLSLTACSAGVKSASASFKSAVSIYSGPSSSYNTHAKPNIDLNAEAATLKSTPGQVALSLIICRLDNSEVLDELASKDPQDLFNILTETALQKSQSLQSLDEQYDLTDILASGKIYVTIKSNDVSSAPAPKSSSTDWIAKFQSAYNAG